jgi:hypothetical protein
MQKAYHGHPYFFLLKWHAAKLVVTEKIKLIIASDSKASLSADPIEPMNHFSKTLIFNNDRLSFGFLNLRMKP